MPLVQAKCTNCGANLEINNTLDAAVCPYCGAAFIVEKAINNFNTTNHINAGVVNVYGGNSADFVIRGGVLEKYNGAATEVVIPNSVKIIGDKAFYNCKGITSVDIPDSVQEIGLWAFYECKALPHITIPDSVQKIGQSAFEGCTALAAVVIPDSVKEIRRKAFAECISLTAIVIPASVQTIGPEAFLDCKSLRTVEIKGNTQCYSNAFWGTPYQEAKDQEARRQWEAKRRQEAEQKSGCYIATAVYGSYDCPEVWTLRRFRDNTLDRTWYGRAFIHTYYAVSPTLVRWFGKDSWFQALFHPMLDRLVARLRQSGCRKRHIRTSIKSGIHCAQVTNRGRQSRRPLQRFGVNNVSRGGRLCPPCSIKQQKRRPAPSLLSFRLPLYHNIAPRLHVKGLKIHLLKGDPAVTEHLRLLRAVAAFDAPQLLLRRNG